MGPGGGEEQVEGEEKQGRKRRRGGWGRAREVLCGDVRRVWMGAEGGGGRTRRGCLVGRGRTCEPLGGSRRRGGGRAPPRWEGPTPRATVASPHRRRTTRVMWRGYQRLVAGGRREALRTIFFLALPLCSPPSGWRRHSAPRAIQGGYCTVHCKRRHLRTPFHPHRTGHGGVRGGRRGSPPPPPALPRLCRRPPPRRHRLRTTRCPSGRQARLRRAPHHHGGSLPMIGRELKRGSNVATC